MSDPLPLATNPLSTEPSLSHALMSLSLPRQPPSLSFLPDQISSPCLLECKYSFNRVLRCTTHVRPSPSAHQTPYPLNHLSLSLSLSLSLIDGQTGRPALARYGPARPGPALCRHGGLPCRAVPDHRAEVAAQARP
jgi:hypothetical protein